MSPPIKSGFGLSDKIQSPHLDRLAVVYVRQSTLQQVHDHQESTRLQYGLVARAEAWGWRPERILTIDEDLGKSGSSAVELIPGLGAVLGIATYASLIYSVGYFACRYYETKRSAPTEIAL